MVFPGQITASFFPPIKQNACWCFLASGVILVILKEIATTNQGFQSLIPLKKINNEFLYYLILTLKNKLLKLASGSTFLEVSPNKIKNLLIPLPL